MFQSYPVIYVKELFSTSEFKHFYAISNTVTLFWCLIEINFRGFREVLFADLQKLVSTKLFSFFYQRKKILPGIFLARFQFLKNNYTY